MAFQNYVDVIFEILADGNGPASVTVDLRDNPFFVVLPGGSQQASSGLFNPRAVTSVSSSLPVSLNGTAITINFPSSFGAAPGTPVPVTIRVFF